MKTKVVNTLFHFSRQWSYCWLWRFLITWDEAFEVCFYDKECEELKYSITVKKHG